MPHCFALQIVPDILCQRFYGSSTAMMIEEKKFEK
jgi:hypothetical protein